MEIRTNHHRIAMIDSAVLDVYSNYINKFADADGYDHRGAILPTREWSSVVQYVTAVRMLLKSSPGTEKHRRHLANMDRAIKHATPNPLQRKAIQYFDTVVKTEGIIKGEITMLGSMGRGMGSWKNWVVSTCKHLPAMEKHDQEFVGPLILSIIWGLSLYRKTLDYMTSFEEGRWAVQIESEFNTHNIEAFLASLDSKYYDIRDAIDEFADNTALLCDDNGFEPHHATAVRVGSQTHIRLKELFSNFDFSDDILALGLVMGDTIPRTSNFSIGYAVREYRSPWKATPFVTGIPIQNRRTIELSYFNNTSKKWTSARFDSLLIEEVLENEIERHERKAA